MGTDPVTTERPPLTGTIAAGDLEALSKRSAAEASQSVFDKLIARMREEKANPAPTTPAEQRGMLGNIVGTLDTVGGLDIPFGSVLVGAIPAVVVGELVDGFVPPKTATGAINWMNVGVKIAAAIGGVQVGRQFMGPRATTFFTGVLALQMASAVLPIDQWIANLIGMFRRAPGVVQQAQSVAARAWHAQSFAPSSERGAYWA